MNQDTYTISEQMLNVGDGHQLYVQEWGNATAQTTFLFLHGGPGSGCNDSHKQLFDPQKNHVVFFDQRGSGKSTPAGSLENNTTEHLIADIELLADKFGLKQFVLVGGSWGSTLALAYALEHPDRVKAMVLRGIFTGSQDEIDFLDKGGFKAFYPEVWEQFVASVPADFQNDPAAYHGPRAIGDDPEARKASAYAYSQLEGSIMRLDDRVNPEKYEDFDPNGTSVEVFYMQNHCFLPDEYILKNAGKLTMPIWMVQGRFDAVCPPITAHKLHGLLPNSKLIWTTAGHSGNDRANIDVTKTIIASFS